MPIRKNKKVKILLTGGHAATTALSVVEEIIRRSSKKNSWEIYWIGSKKAVEGKSVPTLEATALPKLGVATYAIVMGRIQRRFTFWSVPSLAKIPLGFIHAIFLLLKIKPDIIVSFGGYAAFPVVVIGRFLRIPSILHEQTMHPGLANKYSVPFVTKIALARNECLRYFPKEKTVITGNPILTQVSEVGIKEVISNTPVIYITLGSRGSQQVNTVVEKALPKLLQDCHVIHLTGFLDYDKFKRIKESLPKDFKDRYDVYAVVDPLKLDDIYRISDIVVARAGANTVAEIIATKRPAILIPLPMGEEQMKNALFAKKFGIARVVQQNKLTPQTLLKEIKYMRKNWNRIVQSVSGKTSPDKEAANRLVDVIEEILK